MAFVLVHAGYKFQKFESCNSSDMNFAELEACNIANQVAVNIVVNIKTPMNKINVNKWIEQGSWPYCLLYFFYKFQTQFGLYRLENSEFRQFFKGNKFD